jgi:hypothetical protein
MGFASISRYEFQTTSFSENPNEGRLLERPIALLHQGKRALEKRFSRSPSVQGTDEDFFRGFPDLRLGVSHQYRTAFYRLCEHQYGRGRGLCLSCCLQGHWWFALMMCSWLGKTSQLSSNSGLRRSFNAGMAYSPNGIRRPAKEKITQIRPTTSIVYPTRISRPGRGSSRQWHKQ